MRYWEECVSLAFDEVGIVATREQIATVAEAVEAGHENYGMAHGYDQIPNPLMEENDRLCEALKTERSKVVCGECGGRGRIITYGPYHSADSTCYKCHGEGKVVR